MFRWSFIGNLGADPEMRYTPSGQSVTNFRVAINSSYKDKDGVSQKRTDWVNVVAWGTLATNTNQYLRKGSQVYVEGTRVPVSEVYTGKDGNPTSSIKYTADRVQFLDRADAEGSGSGKTDGGGSSYMDDEIPF